jgi:O-antigen ligase
MYARQWHGYPLIDKIIGAGRSSTYYHNDFLRVLYSGGILLLIFYGAFILFFAIKVFYAFTREGKIIHFVSLLGIAYYLAESLGQVPGFYPIIQPVTWGLIGLSLNQSLR